jgi:hypothetical protein
MFWALYWYMVINDNFGKGTTMSRRNTLGLLILFMIWPGLSLAQAGDTNEISVEAQLCTGVEELMPVGMADQFPADVGQVYLWSKISGCMDTTVIKHVWYFKGDEMAVVELPVRGSAWRTYSYKTIAADWSGDWAVKVIDAEGNVLKALPFTVGKIEEEPPAKEAAPAEEEKVEDTTVTDQ